MPVSTVISAGGIVAGKKAIEKVVDDLYGSAKGAIAKKFRSWKNNKKLESLYTQLSSVRSVKTIWQIDREIDLLEFYYPSRVVFDDKPLEIRSTRDFTYDGNLVLKGIVGQGKSIFLRFLCSQEMYLGKRIPVFLELRRVTNGSELVNRIIERMQILGFDINKRDFNYLAKQGKIILFLDGFDEIPEAVQPGFVTAIEELTEKYETIRIIVTSRPDTQIMHSPRFRVFSLASISAEEIPDVIRKLTEGNELADRLIASLNDDPGTISGVLTTPLMITLLVITYRAGERLPDHLSEFYEELFSILITRHDKTKPGFIRQKTCGLNDKRIQELFDVICFLTRQDQRTRVSESQMALYARTSIELCGVSCDEQALVDDIRKITNLLMKEGTEYYFIHKSVQEYHCASYLGNLQDDKQSARFYLAMRKGKWTAWREEMNFLKSIDEFRFALYFYIPDAETFFKKYVMRVPKSWKQTPQSVVRRFLEESSIIFWVSGENDSARFGEAGWIIRGPRNSRPLPWCVSDRREAFVGELMNSLFYDDLLRARGSPSTETISESEANEVLFMMGENIKYQRISVNDAIVSRVFDTRTVSDGVHEIVSAIFSEYRNSLSLVAAHKKRKDFLHL